MWKMFRMALKKELKKAKTPLHIVLKCWKHSLLVYLNGLDFYQKCATISYSKIYLTISRRAMLLLILEDEVDIVKNCENVFRRSNYLNSTVTTPLLGEIRILMPLVVENQHIRT